MATANAMRLSVPSRRAVQADWVAAALILLVTVASRAVWFGDPAADYDEQLYSLIGQGMLDGKLPFFDLWDRKPFGLFALFALAHALGGPGPLAYQLLATAFVAAGAWLTYLLARPLVDRVTACGAALLYPLLLYAYGSFSGQSEAFFLPLILGALWLVRDLGGPQAEARALAAMLLGGLALQVKYTVLPGCLFTGLVVLWHFRHEPPARLATRGLVYALVGLAPTAAVAGFYAASGHFDAFLHANLWSNFERVPAGRFDRRFLAPLAPLALLAAGGLYAALRLRPPGDGWVYRLYVGWSAAALAGIFLPGTVYIYYFAAFVPAAILLALPLLDRSGRLGWLPLVLVLGAGLALLNLPRHIRATERNRAELSALATRIQPHVGHSRDCLFVFDGPAALYRMTDSCLPSRFIYPDHLNNALEAHALGVDQAGEVARILANRPGAIVTADQPVTEQNGRALELVSAAIRQHYRLVGKAWVRDRTVFAWMRRD